MMDEMVKHADELAKDADGKQRIRHVVRIPQVLATSIAARRKDINNEFGMRMKKAKRKGDGVAFAEVCACYLSFKQALEELTPHIPAEFRAELDAVLAMNAENGIAAVDVPTIEDVAQAVAAIP